MFHRNKTADERVTFNKAQIELLVIRKKVLLPSSHKIHNIMYKLNVKILFSILLINLHE